MITAMRIMNRMSTALELIFLLNERPNVAPTTANTIIKSNKLHSNWGTLLVTSVVTRDRTWEKKITNRELRAAVLVSIEKRYDRIMRFMGHPPIPKNEESTPRTKPDAMTTALFSTLFVLILSFFSV